MAISVLTKRDVTTSVRIVQEFGAIDHEAQRWNLLADETNSPMHQYGWVKACSSGADSDLGNYLHICCRGRRVCGGDGELMECRLDAVENTAKFPEI